MKNIKLLMLMLAALPFFASCSDDDDVNTRECTVGFSGDAISVDETAGYVQIPITVSGHRNGPVRVKIESAAVGEDGAVEGENRHHRQDSESQQRHSQCRNDKCGVEDNRRQ